MTFFSAWVFLCSTRTVLCALSLVLPSVSFGQSCMERAQCCTAAACALSFLQCEGHILNHTFFETSFPGHTKRAIPF